MDVRGEVIDTHAHVWSPGRRHPAQRGHTTLPSSADDLLAVMADAGVGAAMVSTTSLAGERDILDASALSDQRLLPVLTIDAGHVREGAPPSVAGFRGIRLVGEWCGDSRTDLEAIVRVAHESSLPLQWTQPLTDAAADAVQEITALGVTQVIDHLGLIDPFSAKQRALLVGLAEVDRVFLKLSGLYALSGRPWPYPDLWPLLQESIEAFGADRVIWGSDWPLSAESASYRQQLELLTLLPFISAEGRTKILRDNPRSLWPAP